MKIVAERIAYNFLKLLVTFLSRKREERKSEREQQQQQFDVVRGEEHFTRKMYEMYQNEIFLERIFFFFEEKQR
jgi:hypothetical protein